MQNTNTPLHRPRRPENVEADPPSNYHLWLATSCHLLFEPKFFWNSCSVSFFLLHFTLFVGFRSHRHQTFGDRKPTAFLGFNKNSTNNVHQKNFHVYEELSSLPPLFHLVARNRFDITESLPPYFDTTQFSLFFRQPLFEPIPHISWTYKAQAALVGPIPSPRSTFSSFELHLPTLNSQHPIYNRQRINSTSLP